MMTRLALCASVFTVLCMFAGQQSFAQTSDGTIVGQQKISDTVGGFMSTLANNDFLGSSVTWLGDIDGDADGRQEVAIGAFGDDTNGSGNGAVYVVSLNPDGTVNDTFTEQRTVGSASQSFGISVATLEIGDGGLPELAVGANGDDTGGNDRGAVHIFSLSAAGISTLIDTIDSTDIPGLEDDDLFGSSVTSLGNLDGVGGIEIAVGAPDDDDGGTDRGALWILSLNPDGTFDSVLQKISDTATDGAIGGLADGGNLGQSVAWLGDLGAGTATIAGGTFRDDTGGTARGAVWILFVNADGSLNSQQQIADGTGGFGGTLSNSDQFGNSVVDLGDLDGDGNTELGVGAPQDDDGLSNAGAVWVLFLNDDGTVASEQKISSLDGGLLENPGEGDTFGWALGALDDLDGNGVVDLAVGARRNDDGGSNRGALHVLFLNAFPTCDAGGEYTVECNEASGAVQLAGTGADGDGDVTYQWSSDCDGASFDNATLEDPVLSVNAATADLGDCEVTLTVTDDQGTTTDCTAQVTIADTTPPVPVCQNLFVELDGGGSATIVAANVDDGSNDACDPAPNLSLDISSFSCSDIGSPVVVELTVTDASGNSDSCTAQVTVEDNVGACGPSGPTAVCMAASVELDASGSAMITAALVDRGSTFGSNGPAASDALTVSPDTFGCSDLGNNKVTLTVTDASGQTSICDATVSVSDATPPEITCPGDQTLECTDPTGEVVTFSATATDTCSTPTVTCTPPSGSLFPPGTTVVTCEAVDAEGNDASCTFRVTVQDTTPPTALCRDVSLVLDEVTGEASVTPADVDNGSSDDCGPVTLALDQTEFDCDDVGVNTVTLTVTDAGGRTSTCTAMVTVDQGLANCDSPDPVVNQVPGDCNQNGVVGVSDAVCILRGLYFRRRSFPCGDGRRRDPGNIALLDWQSDGRISLSDATSLLRSLFFRRRPHPLGVPGAERTTCVFIEGCPDTMNCDQ